jgi:hypothetical protein
MMISTIGRFAAMLAVANYLIGCSTTRFDYTPPREVLQSTSITIKNSFDEVWTKSIRSIGTSFFVLNNIVKDSKIINLSYSGDPEKYVDCGIISIEVSTPGGDRQFQYPASRRTVQYETAAGFRKARTERHMNLEGRINILFEEVNPGETKITAVVRYIVSRTGTITVHDNANNRTTTAQLTPLTLSFNSGSSDSATAGDSTATCRPTGVMEKALLDLISA